MQTCSNIFRLDNSQAIIFLEGSTPGSRLGSGLGSRQEAWAIRRALTSSKPSIILYYISNWFSIFECPGAETDCSSRFSDIRWYISVIWYIKKLDSKRTRKKFLDSKKTRGENFLARKWLDSIFWGSRLGSSQNRMLETRLEPKKRDPTHPYNLLKVHLYPFFT